ncbi:nucleotide sugar dehydrogenase [Latilactobacillus fragifolii]|uniref:nucleotide sugar dehydrogenase n=1 Tax=Latilactobacillus fragifolii TaxID=2814244 RepID=UPI001ABBCB7B|nr:nucleotide sugar dehydrogenase [Latilactobacillus fragifolii]
MKILTIGLGYIGLPTAVMFANYGQEVIGVDVKKEVVASLQNGRVHLEEPGLQTALSEAIRLGNFKAQTNVENADTFIVAVPTPNKKDQYMSCDLTYVISAVNSLIPYLQKGNTVIIESTIAPRTTNDIIMPMIEEAGFKVGQDIFLVHCPERVLPGQILNELRTNNRIIGGVTPACVEAGKKVYGIFVEGELITSSATAAELSKLMENTYRDVNIALANELVKVGYELDIDSLEVIEMANKHPRVNIHQPGPGVGGHCLAVDPYFIIAEAPEQTPLIQQARAINTSMPNFVVDKINNIMSKNNGKKVTILGVAYKGNVDDIRESPALKIIDQLKQENNYEVSVFDPHVKQDWIEDNLDHAVENSDLLVVLTDHNEFKIIDRDALKTMKHRWILDTKNIIQPDTDMTLLNLGNISKRTMING